MALKLNLRGLSPYFILFGLYGCTGQTQAAYWGVSRERALGISHSRYIMVFEEFVKLHATNPVFALETNPPWKDTIPYVCVKNGFATFPCKMWDDIDWNLSVPTEGVWTNSIVLTELKETIPVLEFLIRATRDLHEASGEDVVIYMPAFDFPDWAPPLIIASSSGETSFPMHVVLEAWEEVEKALWNRKIGYHENILRIDHDFSAIPDPEWWYNESMEQSNHAPRNKQ